MAKKEFDIDNEAELRALRAKWIRKSDGRSIKPYFFGHVDKTKGYYNENRKKYMKHDTSMDYLREIIEKYRTPNFTKNASLSLIDILPKYDFSHNSASRKQIGKIMYQIEQFKKTSYFIWSGYAEDSEKFRIYQEHENKLIDSINEIIISVPTLYELIKRMEANNFPEFVLKILFNIGNGAAFDLLSNAKSGISLIEEASDGDIGLYGLPFKKIQKSAIFDTKI